MTKPLVWFRVSNTVVVFVVLATLGAFVAFVQLERSRLDCLERCPRDVAECRELCR